MEVSVLRTESIKPSSPTPTHLKIHKQSSLEQSMPHHYIPMFFFYPNPSNIISPNTEERSQLLKTSLSHLLCRFYPFAGTFSSAQSSILCDDHGVPFTHAAANIHLVDLLRTPDLINCLPQLLPDQSDGENGFRTDVTMVQVTDFPCGGFVISALFSHAVADMAAVVFFVKRWASLCGGSDLPPERDPDFSASLLFPPADDHHVGGGASLVPHRDPYLKHGKLRVRRLVFNPSAIRALKEEAASERVPHPTKVEVISAYLSTFVINLGIVSQMVNLRRRAEPPLHEGSIGNYLWPAVVRRSGEQRNTLADLVSELREATDKIDGDFVKRMRAIGPNGLMRKLRKMFLSDKAAGSGEFVQLTSRCNFGLYDVNFGWGRPIWVCGIVPPSVPVPEFINLVILMDTRCRDGVEVILFVDEEVIALLESSQQLRSYAAFDQSPLDTWA